MSRTRLGCWLRRLLVRAAWASARGRTGADLDDLLAPAATGRGPGRPGVSRRRWVQAAVGLWVLGGSAANASARRLRRGGRGELPARVRVAVVGAGLAGLVVTHRLAAEGIDVWLFEASERVGGRAHSRTSAVAEGVVSELGGTFLSSAHREILDLADELGVELTDWEDFGGGELERRIVHFGGRIRSDREVAEALIPFARRSQQDASVLPDYRDYPGHPEVARFDRLSLEEYLAGIEMESWVRDFLRVNYETEFGGDAGDLSAVNALEMVTPRESTWDFDPIGLADERFTVRGGNQRLAEALADAVGERLRRGSRLAAVEERTSGGYRLVFGKEEGGKTREVLADLVVLAIPFSVLRGLDLRVELPEWKRRVIRGLAYGNSAKLVLGMERRVWQEQGSSGYVYGDLGFQCGWDDEGKIGEGPGGYSMFMGGRPAERLAEGTAGPAAERHLGGLGRIFPEVGRAWNGRVVRRIWARDPLALGGYSHLRVGDASTLCGKEATPVGGMWFAGEHCTPALRAFLGGAVRSGEAVARHLLADPLSEG